MPSGVRAAEDTLGLWIETARSIVVCAVGHGLIEELIGGLCSLVPQLGFPLHAVAPLLVVVEFEAAIVHHVLGGRPFECHKDVVLVGGEELVGGRHHVVGVVEREVRHGKLHR